LLGFITTLKETADCKIALILNDAQVSDQDGMYQLYREKVIDKEIKFDPTVDEAIAWGLGENMPHYGQVKDRLRLLDLRNVRILKKSNEHCSRYRAFAWASRSLRHQCARASGIKIRRAERLVMSRERAIVLLVTTLRRQSEHGANWRSVNPTERSTERCPVFCLMGG
jgi:hypothetical protein